MFKRGFTLIELLIVVAILGIMATIIFNLTGNARVQARDTKRIEDLRQVQLALELYYYDNNSYPTMRDNSNLASNWSNLITTLESGKYLARAQEEISSEAPQLTLQDKLMQWIDFPSALASSLNTKVQDPNYPNQTYAYMPSLLPSPNQNFRIRAKLENSSNSALKTSFSGKFLYSDEDPQSYPGNPQNECAPLSGYYCVGPVLNSPSNFSGFDPGKPVIYLYPQITERVSVNISPKAITNSVPAYNNGWSVMAHPNGKIYDYKSNNIYPYLFWEGTSEKPTVDETTGAVVPTREIAQYLKSALLAQGLSQSETQDFIDYWAPRLTTSSPYTYIYFMPQADYNKLVPMTITPAPDTLLRIYMLWKPLDQQTSVTPQHFSAPTRTGFTVVEWGGDRAPIQD